MGWWVIGDSERMGLSDIGLMDERLECGMGNCKIQGTLRFSFKEGLTHCQRGGNTSCFSSGPCFFIKT